ncbi:MAG: hypothetical protein Q8L27_03890, partial [archaeon]|nr:hypothetical protein [archaeon]
TDFYIPVHPKFLNEEHQFDETLASQIFPIVAEDWYNDLKQHTQTANLDKQTKEWYEQAFLKEFPKIKNYYGRQAITSLNWEDNVSLKSNGFARAFSINRNSGGILYFHHEFECETCIPLAGCPKMLFSEEKIREFSERIVNFGGDKGGVLYVYRQHNVDYYPGALFLRNWSIAYMNEAFQKHQDIFKS